MVSLEEWIREYFTPNGLYYDGEENFHTWQPGTTNPPSRPRPYTNVGFGLLGLLVETLTNSSFTRYCQERIFRPLGMEHSGWLISEVDTRRHAVPYSIAADELDPEFEPRLPSQGVTKGNLKPGGYLPHCLYSFYNYPDGLVRTSVHDLSRYLRAYINGGIYAGARILRKETVETIFSEEHYGHGLCWSKRNLDNGDVLWGHRGGDPGISTYMAFRPEDGVGIIVFFNLDRPGDASNQIFERLLEEVD
jgi:CubicO group peptidase (beta-lactamase class C family)